MRTVFQKIGGKPAIDAAVDLFYQHMLADERVKHFFDGVNMDKQRDHQKQFIAHALGGDKGWDGLDMREAHRHLGLNNADFDATIENLVKALTELDVPDELIEEAGMILETTRADVLNQ